MPEGTAKTTLTLPFNDRAALEALFAARGGEIAAVILEPVVGNMGCVAPEDGFLAAIVDLCKRHGADTVRAYLMFGYRWADGGPWSSENIEGVARWLNRVWHVAQPSAVVNHPSLEDVRVLRRFTHQTIKRVTNDLEAYEFNTIIAALMTLTNGLYKLREATEGSPEWNEAIETMLKLMAPITPHIAEELWVRRGNPYSIHQQAWPAFDAAAAAEELITLVVQINGKVRDRIEVAADISEAEAKATALASEQVQKHLDGKAPKKIVYVTGKLVSIVV